MKPSSLEKLKIWLSHDGLKGHPSDQKLFYEFLFQYIQDHGYYLNESDLVDLICTYNTYPINRDFVTDDSFHDGQSSELRAVRSYASSAFDMLEFAKFLSNKKRGE